MARGGVESRWDLLARSIIILTTDAGAEVKWKVMNVNAQFARRKGTAGTIITVISLHTGMSSTFTAAELDQWMEEGLIRLEVQQKPRPVWKNPGGKLSEYSHAILRRGMEEAV